MKMLKTFVCQKSSPKGNMVEGWLVQESCVSIYEYLGCVDKVLLMLWSTKDDDRLVDQIHQGKRLMILFDGSNKGKIQSYCIANAIVMDK